MSLSPAARRALRDKLIRRVPHDTLCFHAAELTGRLGLVLGVFRIAHGASPFLPASTISRTSCNAWPNFASVAVMLSSIC